MDISSDVLIQHVQWCTSIYLSTHAHMDFLKQVLLVYVCANQVEIWWLTISDYNLTFQSQLGISLTKFDWALHLLCKCHLMSMYIHGSNHMAHVYINTKPHREEHDKLQLCLIWNHSASKVESNSIILPSITTVIDVKSLKHSPPEIPVTMTYHGGDKSCFLHGKHSIFSQTNRPKCVS